MIIKTMEINKPNPPSAEPLSPIALLQERHIIEIDGNDAPSFLQNIITLDIRALKENEIYPAALLTAQGKILHNFLLFKQGEKFFIDIFHKESEALMGKLQLYRLRSNVNMTLKKNYDIAIYQLKEEQKMAPAGPAPLVASAQDMRFYPQALIIRQIISSEPGQEANPSDRGAKDASANYRWQELYFTYGLIETGQDFPHNMLYPFELAYDRMNALSLNKGCYIGQEVISRVLHRNAIKKRLFLLTAKASKAPKPLTKAHIGQAIISYEKSLGTIIAAQNDKALGILRLDLLKKARQEGAPLMLAVDKENIELAISDCAQMAFLAEL